MSYDLDDSIVDVETQLPFGGDVDVDTSDPVVYAPRPVTRRGRLSRRQIARSRRRAERERHRLARQRRRVARSRRPVVRPRRALNFRVAMLVVFGFALVIRVGAVTMIPDGKNCEGCGAGITISEHVGGDGVFYVLAGQAIADGRGFVNPYADSDRPYAQQPPLWTLMLGATELVGLKAILAKKLLFALLGSATVVLVAFAARRVVSERAGVIAGVIAAVYPGFWLYERNLNAETIVFPLIAIVVILAYRYRERSQWRLSLALGGALGVLILGRSEQALLVPLLLAPLILSVRHLPMKTRLVHLAGATAMIGLVIAPWTIYNLGRFEKPVLLSNGFGYTALAGACDSTFYGARLGSFDETHCVYGNPVVQQAVAPTEDGSTADVLLRKAALQYTKQHLGRLPIVVAAREDRTWSLAPPGLQLRLNEQLLNAPSSVLWGQFVMYWLLFAGAAIGVVLFRRRHQALYVLLAFPTTVLISTAITFGDSRYRAPAEVTIVILAALAIDAFLDRTPPAPQLPFIT